MSTTVFKTLITGRWIIISTIAIASVATMVFFAGCSARRNASNRVEEGVVINGVRWATRNADGLRAFVSSPEAPGGFYESTFVRRNGDHRVSRSNRARDRYTLRRGSGHLTRGGGTWNPCPPGWRLPTIPEFESLIAVGSVWTAVNGVNGRLFGTAPHQLFLPAAGQFDDIYRVRNVNEIGYYLVDVPRRTLSPAGEWEWEELILYATPPRMIMSFCQENVGISRVHSFTAEGLTPRTSLLWEQDGHLVNPGGGGGFGTIPIFPELSVRCVAVTADD